MRRKSQKGSKMLKVVNIADCFEKFSETYSPKIVGELNGQYVMVVRCEDDKVPWHTHDNEDEMFYVIEGVLDIYTRDKTVQVQSGEFCIVPKSTEHRVTPQGHVKLMLFEPTNTAHTGDVRAGITKDTFDRLE
jgi:mannose-6-phosphate isomerase-like protein (cupin superfamily)